MPKFLSMVVAASVAVLSAGFVPITASVAQAKTANQMKNESKAKTAKAHTAAKSAARKSKK